VKVWGIMYIRVTVVHVDHTPRVALEQKFNTALYRVLKLRSGEAWGVRCHLGVIALSAACTSIEFVQLVMGDSQRADVRTGCR